MVVSILPSVSSNDSCALSPSAIEGEAVIIATGFLYSSAHVTSHSNSFYKTPDIPAAYSGVQIISALDSPIVIRKALTTFDGLSRSMVEMRKFFNSGIDMPSRIKVAIVFNIFVLDEPSRMLPKIATIFFCLFIYITSVNTIPIQILNNQKCETI